MSRNVNVPEWRLKSPVLAIIGIWLVETQFSLLVQSAQPGGRQLLGILFLCRDKAV
jgi:hypothetical protein